MGRYESENYETKSQSSASTPLKRIAECIDSIETKKSYLQNLESEKRRIERVMESTRKEIVQAQDRLKTAVRGLDEQTRAYMSSIFEQEENTPHMGR